MLYSRFCFLITLQLPQKVHNVSEPPFRIIFAAPNHEIDFVDENENVEQAYMCPERIAQVLVAQLNHTTTILKRFLAEHGEGKISSATSQKTRR